MKAGNETKPVDDLTQFEKLNFYSDFYKFYSEMPFKIVAAYSIAAGLILNVTTKFTKQLIVIGPLAAIIMAMGVLIGIIIAKVDSKYLEPAGNEIESLIKELGLSIGPNLHVTRFIFRLTVILLLLVPSGAFLLLI